MAIPELTSNLPRVLKKILKPVLNSFIKIEPRFIKGGTRWVPEKTFPIAIPNRD